MEKLSNHDFARAWLNDHSELNAELLVMAREDDSRDLSLTKAIAREIKGKYGIAKLHEMIHWVLYEIDQDKTAKSSSDLSPPARSVSDQRSRRKPGPQKKRDFESFQSVADSAIKDKAPNWKIGTAPPPYGLQEAVTRVVADAWCRVHKPQGYRPTLKKIPKPVVDDAREWFKQKYLRPIYTVVSKPSIFSE